MTIEMVLVVVMLASVAVAVVVLMLSKAIDQVLRWSDQRNHQRMVRWSRDHLRSRLREKAHVGWAEQFGYFEGLIPYHKQLALASWTRPSACERAQERLLLWAILLHLIVEEGGREEAAPAFARDLEDVLFQ